MIEPSTSVLALSPSLHIAGCLCMDWQMFTKKLLTCFICHCYICGLQEVLFFPAMRPDDASSKPDDDAASKETS